jgi:O-acetyl-ADP-ribose deacetylase
MINIRQSCAIASATSSPGFESCFPAAAKVRGGIEGITHDDFACALSSFPFMKFGLQYAGADSAGISTDCPEAKYRNHRRMEIIKSISINDAVVNVIRGDLTGSNADAIVNAANSHLRHGGGVAGTIVRKGGRVIQDENDRISYAPVGQCALTSDGSLKARRVIHAAGPGWGEGDEEVRLRNAVINTLTLASQKGFGSISIPAISAGIFGFPKRRCAEIIIEKTATFLTNSKNAQRGELLPHGQRNHPVLRGRTGTAKRR